MTPQRIVFEEVAGTRWTPYEAIFARASKHVMAQIEIARRGCLARIWVDDVALVSSISRAGYSMRDQSGERPLRAVDVAIERRMIERAVASPTTILSWPRRRARTTPAPAQRRVDSAVVRSMKTTTWEWTVTEVGRGAATTFADARVWSAYAWCLVLDEPSIEVGIRMQWRKKPPGPEVREARRRLASALGPFGYVSSNVRGQIIFEKSVRNVLEARDERARLDALLR